MEKPDPIARFLYTKAYYARTKGKVKSAAFMPKGHEALSVFVVKGLGAATVWRLGSRAGERRTSPLKGFAAVTFGQVNKLPSVSLVFDNKPWRHASIAGWPNDKEARKMIAVELADSATLVVREEAES